MPRGDLTFVGREFRKKSCVALLKRLADFPVEQPKLLQIDAFHFRLLAKRKRPVVEGRREAALQMF
jgi:hypothetical protein